MENAEGAAGPATNETNTTEAQTPAQVFRAIDPNARQLWEVQGPRDTGGRLECWLVKISRTKLEVIVHRFGKEWVFYGELNLSMDEIDADLRACLEAHLQASE